MAKKDKKVKKIKASKVDEQKSKKVKIVNLFTAQGLEPKHRSMFFQEARFQDQVPVLKNKTAFPYMVNVVPNGEFSAMLVQGGEATGFYSRTGVAFQNLKHLLSLTVGLADGIYMGTLYVNDKSVAEAKKVTAMFSPFRKAKLTQPQQLVVDADLKFLADDYVTLDEFSAGTTVMKYKDRLARMVKCMKKTFKKQGLRYTKINPTIVDSQSELDEIISCCGQCVTVRGDNPYVAGHKNYYYMKKAPYLTGEFNCVGHSSDLKGNVMLTLEVGGSNINVAKSIFTAKASNSITKKVIGDMIPITYLEVGTGSKPVGAVVVDVACESDAKKDKKAKPAKKSKKSKPVKEPKADKPKKDKKKKKSKK